VGKVEALETLLPLLESYLEMAPGALHIPSYSGEVRGGEREESFKWMHTKSKLWSRYRLFAVSRSFEKLCEEDPIAGRSIYWTLVCPWDRFKPNPEAVLRGLHWMADEIPGELPVYLETKHQTAVRLYKAGMTRDQITGVLHMSARDVSKAIKKERANGKSASVRSRRVRRRSNPRGGRGRVSVPAGIDSGKERDSLKGQPGDV
jgi:hypothetical protein